jgi:hypothetical protein
LVAPLHLTEVRTPLRCYQCSGFRAELFDRKLVLWAYRACRLPSTLQASRCAMEVTVHDHWRRRSRIPVHRPNGLRRSVGARAGRTRCEPSGHRRSAPNLHASPPTDLVAVLRGFPQPAHRRVRRQRFVLPVGSRLLAPAVDVRLRASWREHAPGVDARLRASAPRGW